MSTDPVTDLRQRLIDAKLAGQHWGLWQYTYRSNENAAAEALAVFVGFLREQAAAATAEPAESGQCRCGRRAVVTERAGRITALGALANSIEAGDL